MNSLSNYFDFAIIILLIVTVFVILFLISNFYFQIITKKVNEIKSFEFNQKLTTQSRTINAVIRILDIIISLTFYFTFLLWFFPLIGFLIKLTSKGSVLVKQMKVGKNGKEFTVYRFRTFYFIYNKLDEFRFPLATEKKLTSVGKFLRRTRLNNLPNIINVLKGDMSLIGISDILSDKQKTALLSEIEITALKSIKPGLFSLYSISEDANNLFSVDVAKFDLYYYQNFSISLYLKILFAAVVVSYGSVSKY